LVEPDPLVNHSWMASDSSGWYNVKIIQYDYASIPKYVLQDLHLCLISNISPASQTGMLAWPFMPSE
jgi:hypothetical protein